MVRLAVWLNIDGKLTAGVCDIVARDGEISVANAYHNDLSIRLKGKAVAIITIAKVTCYDPIGSEAGVQRTIRMETRQGKIIVHPIEGCARHYDLPILLDRGILGIIGA